jgi:hypothetical protein
VAGPASPKHGDRSPTHGTYSGSVPFPVPERDEASNPRDESRTPARDLSPRWVWRRVAPALVVNHVLILAGAYFVIEGAFRFGPAWIAAGAALLAGGVGIEVGILFWSARLARKASGKVARPVRLDGSVTVASARVARCFRCGWHGEVRRQTCPRCGGVLLTTMQSPGGE